MSGFQEESLVKNERDIGQWFTDADERCGELGITRKALKCPQDVLSLGGPHLQNRGPRKISEWRIQHEEYPSEADCSAYISGL